MRLARLVAAGAGAEPPIRPVPSPTLSEPADTGGFR